MNIHTDYFCHHANYRRGRAKPVSFLVYHYVGATGGAEANARYYHNTENIGASAHYFVGHASEGAEIWSSVPEESTAWHCGAKSYKHPACRNANSIGIEMCCKLGPKGWYIEEETLAAAAALGRDIMARYGIPLENVVRHYDVTGKLCPAPLVDETAWANFKKRLEVEEEMTCYKTVDDVPAAYRPAVQKILDKGVLKGYGDGSINVSEDLCRTVTILDRLGLLKGDS